MKETTPYVRHHITALQALPRPEWLVPDYIQEGRQTVLVAAAGTGKSQLAHWISLQTATRGREVLYVATDSSPEDHGDISKRLALGLQIDCQDLPYYAIYEDFHLQSLTKNKLNITPGGLLVIDSLSMSHSLESNNNDQMGIMLRNLRTLGREVPFSLLLLHHKPKGSAERSSMDRLRGASIIGDVVDIVIDIIPKRGLRLGTKRLALEWIKNRNFAGDIDKLLLLDNSDEIITTITATTEEQIEEELLVKIRALPDEISFTGAKELTGIRFAPTLSSKLEAAGFERFTKQGKNLWRKNNA